jgi:hypothetical protein
MWTSTRAVPNRFRRSPACAEKQGPKVELHDIERPIDLGCDAGDRASNIACGLGGVEGWRNIFGSLVHNCQSGIRHIRGRRRAYQCSRTAGGHRGRSGHIRARSAVQLCDYGSRQLHRCSVCLSILAHPARGRPDCVWYRRFPGWGACLVRELVECLNLEFIFRLLDFFCLGSRSLGLRRWSRIRPPSSQAALTAGCSPTSVKITASESLTVFMSALERAQAVEHEKVGAGIKPPPRRSGWSELRTKTS